MFWNNLENVVSTLQLKHTDMNSLQSIVVANCFLWYFNRKSNGGNKVTCKTFQKDVSLICPYQILPTSAWHSRWKKNFLTCASSANCKQLKLFSKATGLSSICSIGRIFGKRAKCNWSKISRLTFSKKEAVNSNSSRSSFEVFCFASERKILQAKSAPAKPSYQKM